MVTFAHKLRVFFDGLVFFLWGKNTFDLVKDLLDGEIKIRPINDFMSFMFSSLGTQNVLCGSQITSAGTAAGLDACLHLLRQELGAELTNVIARRMVVAPQRDGGQAQFIERPVPSAHEASRLSPILDRMRADLSGEHTIRALAAAAGMSSRTFLRRFEAATGQTPARWLLAERLNRARDLLETSSIGVDQVAEAVGLGAPALRHHFRRRFSTTPGAYRARFARG